MKANELLERYANGERDFWRVNLRRANLRRANLRGVDLCEADLVGANLRGADLTEADLREAKMVGADLREADLTWAVLSGADLSEVDLVQVATGKYTVIVTTSHVHVGCERFAREDYSREKIGRLARKHQEPPAVAESAIAAIEAALNLSAIRRD